MKAHKTSTERLTYIQSTLCVHVSRNTYSKHPWSYKSIPFYIPLHIAFLEIKNNRQFLNQNQYKNITNSTNQTSTYDWFRLHSPIILYFNKQLPVQIRQQKHQNKVWKMVIAYNKDTRGTQATSIWCLYPQHQTPHLILPQHAQGWLHSSNWLLGINLLKVNGKNSILKTLLNDDVRNVINEHL